MRLEALKRLPGRPSKENSSPVGNNLAKNKSSEEMAAQVGESKNQIYRYIRLNELIPSVLAMVDEGKIAMRPAVELSYLSEEEQEQLFAAMEYADATPSHAQSIKMKEFSKNGKLTPEVIESIMSEDKPNQKEKINLSYSQARKYIPASVPYEETADYIYKALEYYQRHRERMERNDR